MNGNRKTLFRDIEGERRPHRAKPHQTDARRHVPPPSAAEKVRLAEFHAIVPEDRIDRRGVEIIVGQDPAADIIGAGEADVARAGLEGDGARLCPVEIGKGERLKGGDGAGDAGPEIGEGGLGSGTLSGSRPASRIAPRRA